MSDVQVARKAFLNDNKKTSYLCKECKAMFWSYGEVVRHKGMTGHQTFEVKDL
jgi:hypothetical protein